MEIPAFRITVTDAPSTTNLSPTISWYVEPTAPKYKKVIVNGRVVIVLWDDGTKTRSTCAPDDTFDLSIGFGQCLAKKLYGKKKLARMLKKAEIQKQ